MGLTAEQANERLPKINTPEELRELINQLDTRTHGKVTILYSASVNGSTLHTMDAIAHLKQNPDLRVLDNTEAFKFLDCLPDSKNNNHINNPALRDKIIELYGEKPENWRDNTRANQFLFGEQKLIDGKSYRMPNGAFDVVSANFARGGKGHAVALVGFAEQDRVFGATELPTSLKESGFTHVNGIPTETLRNVAQTESMSEAFGIVRTQSQIDNTRISYTVDANGKVTGLDTGDLLSTRYGVQDTRPNPNLTNGHITHRVSEDLDRVRQTNPEKFAPLRPEHHQYKTVYQTPHIDAQIQPRQQSLSQNLTPFQQAYQRDQLDQTFEQKTIRPHSVDTKHINGVLQGEQKHSIEYQTEQAAKARQIQLERAAEIHPQTTHSKTPHIAGKVIGAAGVVIEAGLGAVEVNQAIKQANSTREQYVKGVEAGGNAAVKSVVTGVAGLGGGIVGGAGGAITPVPGGAAIGAIGVGGAAAYGAGELYEDSASQRAVKAVSRGAGEFAYDHISKEGRLAGDIRELKEQISQTSDPAKTRALNEQLNQTTQAFNVEADKNQRQIDAQKLSDQHFQDLRKEYPRLNQGVVNVELENAIKQGNSPQKALELAVNAGLKHSAYEPVVLADKLKEYGNNAQVEARNSTDTYKESRGGNPTAAQTANLERERHTEFKTNYVSIAQAFERDMSTQATRVRVAEANQYVKAIGKTNFVETYPGSREFPQAARDLMAKMEQPHTYRPVQPPQGLHQGAQGKKVENLQNALNLLGADVATDGHFGKDTTQALKAFQKAHHLKIDGELDLKTHQVMMNAVKQTTVKHVQTTLNELGADLTINGRMDKATVAAVKDFQTEHQLKPTGKLDGLTTGAMAQAVQQQTQQNVSQQRPTAVQEPSVQTTQPTSINPEQQPQIDRMLAVMAQNPALAGMSREEQTTMAMGLINAAVDKPAQTQSAQVTPPETLVVPQSQPSVASQAVTSAAVTTEVPASASLNKTQQGHVDQILGLMADKPEFKAYNPEQQTQMAMGLMVEAAKRGEPMDKLQGIYLPQNGQTLAAQFDTRIGMVHLPTQEALQTALQDVTIAQNNQQMMEQQMAVAQEQSQNQSRRVA